MPSLKRDQVWQRPVYRAERLALDAKLRRLPAGTAVAAFLEERMRAARADPGFLGDLRAYVALACRLAHAGPADTAADVERWADAAADILARYGITRESKLAVARVDFHRAFAHALKATRQPTRALWHATLAREHAAGKDAGEEDDAKGDADAAAPWPAEVDAASPMPDVPRETAFAPEGTEGLGERMLRFLLAGQALEALALWEDASAAAREAAGGIHACRLDAILQGDLTRFRDGLRTGAFPADGHAVLEHDLWAHAMREKTWIAAPRPGGRSGPRKGKAPDRGLAAALRQAYDPAIPLAERISAWETALHGEWPGLSPLLRLLATAAACRFFLRVKYRHMTQLCREHHAALSLAHSGGRVDDVLGLLSDVPRAEPAPTACPHGDGLAMAGWERGAALGELSFHVLRRMGWSQLKRIVRPVRRDKRFEDEELNEVFHVLCEHLGRFKGPLLKFGQLAGTYDLPLPEEARLALNQLSDGTEAIPPDQVAGLLDAAWGRPWQDQLRGFDAVPVGMGSMGQVHRGTLRDGGTVAIKVLYPGIADAVRFDLFVLKTLKPLVKALSPHLSYDAIVAELGGQFLGECDLTREARMQADFRARFLGHPRLVIPRVHARLCAPNVLVTDFVAGERFDAFAAAASQAERDAAAEAIVHFVVRNCRDGYFNTDPNPGNFLFAGGKVHCVDFGNVKRWDETERLLWRDLILSGIHQDKALYGETLRKMGVVADPRRFDFDDAYRMLIASGVMGVTARSGKSRLPLGLVHAELVNMLARSTRNGRLRDFPPAFVMGFRVYLGHLALVARLGAEADWHGIVSGIMHGAD